VDRRQRQMCIRDRTGASGAVQVMPNPAGGGLALILILPPVEVNRYWGS
jgi:hypothetical protein